MLHPLILAETLRKQPAALKVWDSRVGKGASSPTWPPAGCSFWDPSCLSSASGDEGGDAPHWMASFQRQPSMFGAK